MGRSDNSFPPYVKIDIDPQRWPQTYYDSCRQCPNCGIGWPNEVNFHVSPCCNSNTIVADGPPDMRWPEAVTRLLENHFEQWYDQYNEGVDDENLAWEDVKTNGEVDEDKIKDEVQSFIDNVNSQEVTTNE